MKNTLAAPRAEQAKAPGPLLHATCCDLATAFCGHRFTSFVKVIDPPPERRCVVCEELSNGDGDVWPCTSPTCPAGAR